MRFGPLQQRDAFAASRLVRRLRVSSRLLQRLSRSVDLGCEGRSIDESKFDFRFNPLPASRREILRRRRGPSYPLCEAGHDVASESRETGSN